MTMDVDGKTGLAVAIPATPKTGVAWGGAFSLAEPVIPLATNDHSRSLPGLDAWSLACRRKTLRCLWRGWLLKSHKPLR
jgi:hypothetical protein